jgi:lysophospholipase L1-like esterase
LCLWRCNYSKNVISLKQHRPTIIYISMKSKIRIIFISATILMSTSVLGAITLGNTILLGDSITQAAYSGDHQGYRYPLWQKLVDSGASFDFVGSHRHNFNSTNTNSSTSLSTYPSYNGQVFDTDNEGHWGWKTSDVLGLTTPTRTPGTGTGTLSDWLGLYSVDTAFILLGVNDLRSGSVTVTTSNMETIISDIITANSDVQIYLGSILPTSSGFVSSTKINDLNLAYQDIAANHTSVTYLDVADGFIQGTHTYDGVHPNALGEELIATNIFNSVRVPKPRCTYC